MTDPTPRPDAAADDYDPAPDLRRVFAMHSASPPDGCDDGDRSPAINRVIASLGGGYGSTNLDARDVRCLVVAFADAEGIIDALNSQLSSARADLARLRAPLAGDLAAIEARAADLATLRAKLRAYLDDRARSVFDIPVVLIQERDEAERASAADVPALLAHVRRLTAALADSDARVASAVAAERARCAAVCRDIASDATDDDPVSETADACAEAIERASAPTGGAQ